MSTLKKLAEKRRVVEDVDPEDVDAAYDSLPLKRKDEARRKSAGGADVQRSKLRADAEVANLATDPKYAGRVVSLKDLRRQQEEDDEDDEEDEEAGSDDDDDESEADGSDEDDDGDDDDDDDDEDDALARSAPSSSAGRGLIGDVDAELAALESADASQMVQLARAATDDAKKGKDVRHQNALCEAYLESRIRLQKPLTAAARLPPRSVQDAMAAANPDVARALEAARGAVSALLADLLRLRAALIMQHDGARQAAEAAAGTSSSSSSSTGTSGVKRKRPVDDATADAASVLLPAGIPPVPAAKRRRTDGGSDDDDSGSEAAGSAGVRRTAPAAASRVGTGEYWRALDGGCSALSSFTDSAVDTMGRKLAFASGMSSKHVAKLKVMGADISAQVRDLVKHDKDRLLGRTRPVLTETNRPLGVAPAAADVNVLFSAAGDAPAPSSTSATAAAAVAEHVFDDSDFYAQLLREYVQTSAAAASASAAAGGGAGSGRLATDLLASAGLDAALLKHKSVKRAGIDRRATKGRRIKYAVHPKLVSFMAAAPYVVPPDMAFDLDTVVASLFKSQQ